MRVSGARRRFWRDFSIQGKMLVIILPLIVIPMLILGAVGFITASREAAKVSTRYLLQRETDLRTLAEYPAITSYINNKNYGLIEEAEVSRRELERSFKRFAARSNSIELIYPQVRYVDSRGDEIAKVADGRIASERGSVADAPFFTSAKQLRQGEVYLSPVARQRTYAMPVYEQAGPDRPATLLGAVVLDFTYPVQEFQRTTAVIGWTFVIITLVSLGIAVLLVVNRVDRLTNPIRRLAEAANRIAGGQRSVTVAIDSQDEIGRLASAFNEMATSLDRNETALQRKVDETRTLYEIGQEVTAQVALEPTLRLIVERARHLLGADECLLALRHGESDVFATQAYAGTVTEALAQLRFRTGEGLSGRVVASGQPILVGDYAVEHSDSPFIGAIREAGVRSMLAAPLRGRGAVIGVLNVQSRVPHKFRHEDQQLLSALADQAAVAIENARLYEQVRRHAEVLEAKVEARTRELQEANERLEAASRHKSQFLANMSHELRTPLNAILGYTELILDRIYGEVTPKVREVLERLQHSGRHLLGLINDVLDLSKIEAGQLSLSLDDYSITDIVQNVSTAVESLAAEKHLHLTVAVPPSLPPGRGDERRITQVLLNLVGNAIKFTDSGEVAIRATVSDGQFLVAVSDTGPGIAEQDQQKIFEEFQQGNSAKTQRKGGTGLGLSIAKRIIELHRGRLWVESRPGRGSTFWFSIPILVDRPAS